MNEFFAAEPESFENSAEFKLLINWFGPQAGRYLADYPDTWATEVLRRCEALGEMEAARIKTILRRARENASILRNNSLPWNKHADWIDNVREVIKKRPGTIANAIVSRQHPSEDFWTMDDVELPPTAEEAINPTPLEYARVSKTLLIISPELIFADPYLNPCRRDRAKVLEEMFRVASRGKCRQITCWARADGIVGPKHYSWDDVKGAANSILEKAGWPISKGFRLVLVDDATSRAKMHARYLLSIRGAIRYEQGFQELPKGRRNEVGPVQQPLHEQALEVYHEGSHDMRLEYEFNRVTT